MGFVGWLFVIPYYFFFSVFFFLARVGLVYFSVCLSMFWIFKMKIYGNRVVVEDRKKGAAFVVVCCFVVT